MMRPLMMNVEINCQKNT